MNDPDTMICPRCGGPMQTYQRTGVQVDQCQNCKGIFLDRGELEQLINAEQAHYPQDPAPYGGYPPPGYPAPQPTGYPPPSYYDEHHGGHDEHHGHHDEDDHDGYQRRGLFHNLFED